MEISFDLRGNLKPYSLIEMGISKFEELFVHAFPESATRRRIFFEYQRYSNDLGQLIGYPFHQWIDGSFVCKKTDPRDIDVLTFIQDEAYNMKQKEIDSRFSKWSVGKFYNHVDAYTIWAYPEGHKHFLTYQSDLAYWRNWFCQTSFNRAKKRFQKGFVKLKIE